MIHTETKWSGWSFAILANSHTEMNVRDALMAESAAAYGNLVGCESLLLSVRGLDSYGVGNRTVVQTA